jgi:hypothetical protein
MSGSAIKDVRKTAFRIPSKAVPLKNCSTFGYRQALIVDF